MIWMKRFLALVAVLFFAAIGIVAIGVLSSLDWDRSHRKATEALPELGEARRTIETELVQIDLGGMRFRARIAGLDNKGPGLILLHGFPETSAMWTPLIDEAVAAGYRVVAFDQRGYSPGARPDGVAAYVVPKMTADVIGIADAVWVPEAMLSWNDFENLREGWVTDEALVLQRDLVNAPYVERELDAGHFLMQDQPEAVIEAVLTQLAAN